MAAKKFEKQSDEWLMFVDFWKLCQDYWIIEASDEYWDNAVDAVQAFYKKYKAIPLARKLGNAFMDSLAERSKKE